MYQGYMLRLHGTRCISKVFIKYIIQLCTNRPFFVYFFGNCRSNVPRNPLSGWCLYALLQCFNVWWLKLALLRNHWSHGVLFQFWYFVILLSKANTGNHINPSSIFFSFCLSSETSTLSMSFSTRFPSKDFPWPSNLLYLLQDTSGQFDSQLWVFY